MSYSIGALERETGISKETLRIWELRYGFPSPGRSPKGDRVFTEADVSRLRLIKQLLGCGQRPRRVVPMTFEELVKLADSFPESNPIPPKASIQPFLDISLKANDAQIFQTWLKKELQSRTARDFVSNVIAPLCEMIGKAYVSRAISIPDEHVASKLIERSLLQCINQTEPAPESPRVLLATLPGQKHGLGLLMVEAILADFGLRCCNLGVEMQIEHIAECARALSADIVAISFSDFYPAHRLKNDLSELRAVIPARVALWAGGEGMRHSQRQIKGILTFSSFDQVLTAASTMTGRSPKII